MMKGSVFIISRTKETRKICSQMLPWEPGGGGEEHTGVRQGERQTNHCQGMALAAGEGAGPGWGHSLCS